jgi:putative membrane protein
MTTAQDVRFDVEPSVSNHFSWVNTVLSLQRTLMSAARTAVSLIGFGFTVAQFFEKVQGDVPEHLRLLRQESPRNFGLALIGAGVISLAVYTWQYSRAVRNLYSGVFAPLAGDMGRPLLSPVYIVAGAVLVIGVAAFLTIYMRL